MPRRLFNILAAVSLVISVAATVLWVRSYYYGDNMSLACGRYMLNLHSLPGRIECQSEYHSVLLYGYHDPIDVWSYDDPWYRTIYEYDPWYRTRHFYFAFENHSENYIDDQTQIPVTKIYYQVTFPHLAAILAGALLPFAWWLGYRRNKRMMRAGLCLTCGYNLTGNVSGTCPECGTAIPRDLSKESPTT